VDKRKLAGAVVRVIFNQTVVGLPISIVVYHLMQWRGCSFGPELPTFTRTVCEVFVFTWVEEFGFYYSHRLLHHPLIYKHVHKIHHEWTAPIGIIGVYAHPIEMIVSNSMPLVLGPLLCGSHVATAILWYIMAVFSTTIAHCGYHLPFLPSPEAHDFHHLKFTNNFGMLGVLDRLHNTDAMFRASKAYERHFLLLSLVPLKVSIPDNKADCSKSTSDD